MPDISYMLSKYLMHHAGGPAIWCPGCKCLHPYRLEAPKGSSWPTWTWDGNVEKPSFKPSMLINKHHPQMRCHFHVTAGQIIYCSDCHHELSSMTIDLPEIPEEEVKDWCTDDDGADT